MNPKVSVIMPVYNGEKYLKESIESILVQTFKDFEFLIINDGSIDRSVEIIKSYHDKRIVFIDNVENKGLLFTRNKALTEARGEYVAMLDCDDISYKNRLEEQVLFLEKNRDIAIIGTAVELINKDGVTTSFSFQVGNKDEMSANLLFGNCIINSSVMARKNILVLGGGYNNFSFSEDYDLWVRISKNNKIWNMPKILVKYRTHATSIGHIERFKMIDATKKIFKNQLIDLGVNPTDEELSTHFSVGDKGMHQDDDFLLKANLWLNKLKRANKIAKIYDFDVFEKVLNRYWLKIFISSKTIRISNLKILSSFILHNFKFSIYNIFLYVKKFILEKIIKNNFIFK